MKTKLIIINGIAVLMLILLLGCGGNDNNPINGGCNGLTWTEAYENEFQDVSDASTAFANEPTVQSCQAYKTALQDWYNALDGLGENCLIGVTEQEYEQALAQAQESINSIDCTQYEGN